MSFRNHLLLCAATLAVSCRNKFLIQNLILANIKLIFWLVKTILSYFFQTLLPPKITFTSSENIFFNDYFIPASENSFSVWWKQYAFVRSIFFCRWKPWLKLERDQFWQKIIFLFVETIFYFFFQQKQFSRIVEAYFSTNSSFQLLEKDFLFSWNHLTSLESSFLPSETVTDVSENHFLKTDFIHANENSFPS